MNEQTITIADPPVRKTESLVRYLTPDFIKACVAAMKEDIEVNPERYHHRQTDKIFGLINRYVRIDPWIDYRYGVKMDVMSDNNIRITSVTVWQYRGIEVHE